MRVKLPNDPAAALREVARRLESSGSEFSGDHVFTVNTGGLASECRRVADEAERGISARNAADSWLFDEDNHGVNSTPGFGLIDANQQQSLGVTIHRKGHTEEAYDETVALAKRIAALPDVESRAETAEAEAAALRKTVERVKALAESWLSADVASAEYGRDVLLELEPDAKDPESAPVPPKCEECARFRHADGIAMWCQGSKDSLEHDRSEFGNCGPEGKNFEPRKKGEGMSDFYVQRHASGCVGNCLLWWRKGGNGYTCNLDDAEVFDGNDPKFTAITKDESKYTAWLKPYIDSCVHRHVDHQYVSKYQERHYAPAPERKDGER